jgi:hypothetical protein
MVMLAPEAESCLPTKHYKKCDDSVLITKIGNARVIG